jgi:hypothetical protein
MRTISLAVLALATVSVFAQSVNQPPKPEWVPDPSAGHYDCPDGWMAYKVAEPEKPYYGPVAAIYRAPTLDKKGHILDDRPSPGICIKEDTTK